MKNSLKTLAMWSILIIIFIVILTSILDNAESKLAYSELISKIETGEVKEIEIQAGGDKAYVTLKGNTSNKKEVNIPNMESFMSYIEDHLKDGSITLTEKSESIFITFLSLLTPFGILIIFFVFWFLFMNGNAQGRK